MLDEFREFVNRGSFVELAVGFVIGVAFQQVVSTLTERVLMPAIAMIFGEPDFDSLLTFGATDPETGLPTGSVGALLTSVVNLLLVAVALFLVVKAYNRMRRHRAKEPEPEADPEDVALLREIRDELRSR